MAKWTAIKSEGKIYIRRWVAKDGKRTQERLPIHKYRHFRDNPEEIKAFLLRLNESGRQVVEIKHAFISPTLLDEYLELLCTQSENKITARCEYTYVKKYFLDFFIVKEKILDPINWHMNQKTKWAKFLISTEAPPSVSSKKQIIHAVNKFMSWLSEKRPTEVPKMKFEPFTKARLKELEASRVLRKEKRINYFISEKDFKTIIKALDSRILSPVLLSYHFGCRRSEALSLKLEDVKKGFLLVERQLVKIGHNGPNKGRMARKIPYWSTNPINAYNWVKDVKIMHQRTFAALWDKAINALLKDGYIEVEYNLHDLRHTWITRMMRNQNPRDVQMAAGHVSINTTMGYLKDDRNLSEEIFDPNAA